MKKNNEINQNYIALIEQAKEGFYYKSKFENKKFFEKSFLICRSNEEEIDDSDKDLNNEYYELNQGDLIKLGRMYIKIREICINGNIISKKSNDKQNIILPFIHISLIFIYIVLMIMNLQIITAK